MPKSAATGSMLKVGIVQNTATPDLQASIAAAMAMVREAAAAGAELIALPEFFCGFWSEAGRLSIHSHTEERHPAIIAGREEARRARRMILLGSVGVDLGDGRLCNRSVVIDRDGAIIARYDKVHLFDVDLGPGKVYRESDVVSPGGEAVIAGTPWGGLGLSVCYDLRFAALYRTLAKGGARMLAVPAAFTRTTGEAHWHILLRARAIENGAFVIAPCQTGEFVGGGAAYGHSLVIDPWGRVVADGGTGVGVVMAEIDLGEVDRVRARIPSLEHDRPFQLVERRAAAE